MSLRTKVTQAFSAALLSTTLLTANASAGQQDMLVIISNSYDKPEAKEVLLAVRTIASGLPDGGSLTVIDGTTQKEVARFQMPNGEEASFLRSYPRQMAGKQNPLMLRVAGHLKSAMERNTQHGAQTRAQLGLPDMLARLSMFTEGGETVLIMGSAKYFDERYPSFSTLNAYPDAAHARFRTSQTPFGAADASSLPDGSSLHFCDMSGGYETTAHQEGVQKAWVRVFDAYNLKTATFMPLTERCLSRAIGNIDDNAPEVPDTPNTGSLVMWDPSQQPPKSFDSDNKTIATKKAPGPQVDDVAGLNAVDQRRLQTILQAGDAKLTRVAFWDTAEEDGDEIDVKIGSGVDQVRLRIELKKQEVWHVIPATAAGIEIVAVSEGEGGGATLGIRTEDGFVSKSPQIEVGETYFLPLK